MANADTQPNAPSDHDGLPEDTRPGGESWTDLHESAFGLMMDTLSSYGLGSLGDVLKGILLSGTTDEDLVMLELQETQEWKTRFAGNEKLRANGLPVLSVAEYLSTERQYAQVMHNYGLPGGFYDDPADFADFIGKSVSASELQSRVSAWADLAKREDPAIKAQLESMGIGEGDLAAYMMDPDRAAPLIQQKYQSTLIGAAARRQGLDPSSSTRLADLGVTEQQAIQGYGLVAENLAAMTRLGDISGEEYGQRDLEDEVFEQDGAATNKRKRLASQERARFSGQSGVGQGSLSRSTGGQY